MNDERIGRGGGLTILEWALCILLTSIVAVTFTQVVSRYVLQSSLAWTEELARYMFIWLAALGAAYAYKTKAHFLLRFVVDRFSQRNQMVIATLVVAMTSAFFIIFTWQAVLYSVSVAGQIAPGTGLSKSVPASSAVVGGALMLFYSIRNWVDEVSVYRDSASNDGGPA
jgi:TRAP-type C4-dicarboxylate transport system permease small subunit